MDESDASIKDLTFSFHSGGGACNRFSLFFRITIYVTPHYESFAIDSMSSASREAATVPGGGRRNFRAAYLDHLGVKNVRHSYDALLNEVIIGTSLYSGYPASGRIRNFCFVFA
jgi:hypothetical protein